MWQISCFALSLWQWPQVHPLFSEPMAVIIADNERKEGSSFEECLTLSCSCTLTRLFYGGHEIKFCFRFLRSIFPAPQLRSEGQTHNCPERTTNLQIPAYKQEATCCSCYRPTTTNIRASCTPQIDIDLKQKPSDTSCFPFLVGRIYLLLRLRNNLLLFRPPRPLWTGIVCVNLTMSFVYSGHSKNLYNWEGKENGSRMRTTEVIALFCLLFAAAASVSRRRRWGIRFVAWFTIGSLPRCHLELGKQICRVPFFTLRQAGNMPAHPPAVAAAFVRTGLGHDFSAANYTFLMSDSEASRTARWMMAFRKLKLLGSNTRSPLPNVTYAWVYRNKTDKVHQFGLLWRRCQVLWCPPDFKSVNSVSEGTNGFKPV